MLSHFVFRVVPLLSCNCPVARGPVCFVIPAQGSRLPLEHQSLQGLLFSLRCWNLLCTSNLMAIRKESHFYCCHLDHPKPPSRTSFIRKYSKHCKSQVLCLPQVSFTLFFPSWSNVVSSVRSSRLDFLLSISLCFNFKLPSHQFDFSQVLRFLSLLIFCFSWLSPCSPLYSESSQLACLLSSCVLPSHQMGIPHKLLHQ